MNNAYELVITPKLSAADGTSFYSLSVLRYYEETLRDLVELRAQRIHRHGGVDTFTHIPSRDQN